MEAGPRSDSRHDQRGPHEDELGAQPDSADTGPTDAGAALSGTSAPVPGPLDDDGSTTDPSISTDGLDADLLAEEPPAENNFRELRPPLKLRIWQLIPIIAIGALGSLMFAFPLAFEFGDGGPVVAMLGLLLSCCSAGWALMAARRVGYTWPGLPARGSGDRPDWRYIAAYTVCAVLLALLAVWRVARLR